MFKIEILLTRGNTEPPVQWTSDEALRHINDINSMQDIFDVLVSFGGHRFSSYAHSARSLVMDLVINQRLLLSRRRFSFFISEMPLFTVGVINEEVVASFYNQEGKALELREHLATVDCSLHSTICTGIGLLRRIAPDSVSRLFADVHQDLLSENRADFIGV